MQFEFDEIKSQRNKKKHGMDFVEAQRLWFGSNIEFRLITETKLENQQEAMPPEERYAVIGAIEGLLWTAIITYRQGKVRIISVRRSRETEKKTYEEKITGHNR